MKKDLYYFSLFLFEIVFLFLYEILKRIVYFFIFFIVYLLIFLYILLPFNHSIFFLFKVIYIKKEILNFLYLSPKIVFRLSDQINYMIKNIDFNDDKMYLNLKYNYIFYVKINSFSDIVALFDVVHDIPFLFSFENISNFSLISIKIINIFLKIQKKMIKKNYQYKIRVKVCSKIDEKSILKKTFPKNTVLFFLHSQKNKINFCYSANVLYDEDLVD